MKRFVSIVMLTAILLIGIWLRLYRLTDVPHGFFADEASIGYNAYTILHSGKDEYGKIFPIFFQSFGDFKDPLQIYATVPYIAILGLSEYSTRLPAVVWGVLTILGVYLVTKQLRSSYIAALAAAGAAAGMPWLMHYSRIGVEYSLYAATWTWTLFFFLKAMKRKVFFIPTFISLALTLYSYQPAKLFVPLLLVGWVLTYHHMLWRHRKYGCIGFAVFLILAIPMILSFFDVAGMARFAMVSIFSTHLPMSQIVEKMTDTYFYMFSPDFFLSGDKTFITRHFVQGLTPLLPVTLPFLAVGLLYVLFTIRKASSQLLLWLVCIYPVGAMLVADGPFTSRSMVGAPLFAILIGIGIALVIQAARRRVGKSIVGSVILIFLVGNTLYFVNFYFTQYPLYSSDYWGWQYGAGPIMRYFLAHAHTYDDYALSNDYNAPEIFLKFYDPQRTCPTCRIALPEDIFDPGKKQLFALTPDEMTKRPQYSYHAVESINYPNGQEAFRLVTIAKK